TLFRSRCCSPGPCNGCALEITEISAMTWVGVPLLGRVAPGGPAPQPPQQTPANSVGGSPPATLASPGPQRLGFLQEFQSPARGVKFAQRSAPRFDSGPGPGYRPRPWP